MSRVEGNLTLPTLDIKLSIDRACQVDTISPDLRAKLESAEELIKEKEQAVQQLSKLKDGLLKKVSVNRNSKALPSQ